jgi:hypothetical protein
MSAFEILARNEKTLSEWIDVPPVFIVGSPRSGTTLLRLMLTAHPNISISSEGAYIYRFRSKLSAYGDLSEPKSLQAMHLDLLPFLEAEKFLAPPSFEQLLDWVAQFGADPRSLITFYGTWEARILGKSELAWWGDNAPYHVYHVPFFESMFPDCKFIVMVRDPRDACASMKSTWHDFSSALEQWETSMLDGLLAAWRLGPTRVKQIKYEDLVTEPREQLREICEFLNLDYTEEMLAYHESASAKAISQLSHHKNLLRPPFASSVGNYRKVLSEEEIDAIGNRFYSTMRLLNYIGHEEYELISRHELNKVNARRSAMRREADGMNNHPARIRDQTAHQDWRDVPPLFLIGHGRSGTTLLRMMLSAHPKIFISSEGAYVCPLRCNISKYGDLREISNLERLRGDLLPWLEAVNYLSPPNIDDLAAWVNRFGCDERSLVTFYGTWEARILGKKSLAWWGDNEPSHVFNIPYFKELFPGSKFILMVRDPRDVYASFKVSWPGIRSAEGLALRWKKCLLDASSAASSLGDSSIKRVRYEDLVTNPAAQLEEVCEFLRVEYDSSMLNFFETVPARKLSKVNHHRNLREPVFTTSVGKYRQILTQEEIATIQRRLYSPMRSLGYISYEEYDELSCKRSE